MHKLERGFSLVELMIAMAIGLVIISAGAGLYLGSLSAYLGMKSRSSLSQDSVLLVDYFRKQLLSAGGGTVRGWMGIWIEDNCASRGPFPACGRSDRLTVSRASMPLQECAVTSMVSANVLQIAFSSPGVCCMQPSGSESSYFNRNVILTLNSFFSHKFATNVDLTTCQLGVTAGQASGWDQTGGTTNWSGGMVTMVNTETLYLNKANDTLMRFIDANNNNSADADEAVAVAVGVLDFHAALGYDFNPADGRISATANGSNDEWLYNAVGETFGAGFFVGSFTRASLLMVSAAVVLGVPDANNRFPTSQQIMNGATIE